ncbi:MAG: Gfo/Idh/MocA family oxidoreductase [Bacteroidota bacterium]
MSKQTHGINRRTFIQKSALAGGGLVIVPRHVLGGPGYVAPSDKLNIAAIGAGGRARGVLRGISKHKKANIIALCDVDKQRAADSMKKYKKAEDFTDFRKMLDKIHKDVDAVTICSPDHTHAVAAMAAMQLGKHVYVEKPLTHNIHEARTLTEAARKYGVVTQMGNQGNSNDDLRRICEWIWAGTIGEVREVHCWTNRPVWPQGLVRPSEKMTVPKTLDWDLWLGPAPMRPFHSTYLPFSWRGWWDFGTGALGDMACHIIDPAFRALKLGYPDSAEAFASTFTENWQERTYQDSPPNSTMIRFEFPARESMAPVTLTWYDGGLKPWNPPELEEGEMMGDGGGGVLFVGDKGKISCSVYARNPTLLPTKLMKDFKEPDPVLDRVEGGIDGHQTSWVEACMGGPKPSSNFDYSGPLTETVLMGNLAVRSFFHVTGKNNRNRPQFDGRKKLLWDGPNMRITNFEPANQYVRREYREGWSLGS